MQPSRNPLDPRRQQNHPAQYPGHNPFLYSFVEQQTPQQVQQVQQVPQTLNPANNQVIAQPSSHSSSPSYSGSQSSNSESASQKWQHESLKQGDQQPPESNLPEGQIGAKIQKQNDKPDNVIRYKYCCKRCKHIDRDKDKKACVCVVPRDQRRTHLGNEGCQTCGCNGCSKEDFIARGEDPEYHPGEKKKQNKKKPDENFEARNGCCKNCMKAFSKTGKSCICQVPDEVRKTKLALTGCKICGCTGCNPQDKKEISKGSQRQEKRQKRQRSRSERRRQRKEKRSRSKERRRRSKSRSPQIIDTYAMNFHNIDRSIIGSMIINEYQVDPALLGFGIPQRSSSYLFGRMKQK